MIALVAAAALLLAQAGTPSPQAPLHQNRAPVPVVPPPMAMPSSSTVDKLFATAALQGNAAEIEMAQLALRRGTSNEVKGYAGKMLAEHDGMMQELMPALRRAVGTKMPARLAPADALAYLHLQAAPPADFDQAYAMQQIGDHLATLTVFQTEADNGKDAQLKAYARKWLPTIQAHLELAVDMTRHIGGSTPFTSH